MYATAGQPFDPGRPPPSDAWSAEDAKVLEEFQNESSVVPPPPSPDPVHPAPPSFDRKDLYDWSELAHFSNPAYSKPTRPAPCRPLGVRDRRRAHCPTVPMRRGDSAYHNGWSLDGKATPTSSSIPISYNFDIRPAFTSDDSAIPPRPPVYPQPICHVSAERELDVAWLSALESASGRLISPACVPGEIVFPTSSNIPFFALCDTGASDNYMSRSFYNAHFRKLRHFSRACVDSVRLGDGTTRVPIDRIVSVPISLTDNEGKAYVADLEFSVFDTCSIDVIIGLPAIRMDFAEVFVDRVLLTSPKRLLPPPVLDPLSLQAILDDYESCSRTYLFTLVNLSFNRLSSPF